MRPDEQGCHKNSIETIFNIFFQYKLTDIFRFMFLKMRQGFDLFWKEERLQWVDVTKEGLAHVIPGLLNVQHEDRLQCACAACTATASISAAVLLLGQI